MGENELKNEKPEIDYNPASFRIKLIYQIRNKEAELVLLKRKLGEVDSILQLMNTV